MEFPQRLIEGYLAFCANRLQVEQQRYRQLAESGQQPQVMVLGCADSRVSPEVIFDARPGELFVVRNVANLAPPYSPDDRAHGVSAALEFAVLVLKVKHIVVLGHARCGGISAYASQQAALAAGDFIGQWVSLIRPAAEKIGPRGERLLDNYLRQLEQASIFNTMDNLLGFPWLRDLAGAGELHLHAAYFDVASGELSTGDPAAGFAAISGG